MKPGRNQSSTPALGTAGPSAHCGDGRKKREPGISQRTADRSSFIISDSSEVPLIVQEVINSSGQVLDPVTREFMEPRFGHDFSRVRVHTDAKAAASARAVNALAYTVGMHVAVRSDRYAPQTTAGRLLLAHELAHVVQQSAGGAGGDAESRASVAAEEVMRGQHVALPALGAAPLGLYKQQENQEPEKAEIGSDDDIDELIKQVRKRFGQTSHRNMMFPGIPPTSSLNPQWKPTGGIIDMRNHERPTPAPNLDWLSKHVASVSGFGPQKLPPGYNPYNPDVAKDLYRDEYLSKKNMGKNPTEESMVLDRLIKGGTKTLLAPVNKWGQREGKKAAKRNLQRIRKLVPWFWLRRLIPGEEIIDAYSTE